jgi:two-component system CheB/CheR fusion protein
LKKPRRTKKANPTQESGSLPERPSSNDLFIVGIGASAGGIQALRTFFSRVPVDSGMAYVVILHLLPDHDSKLAEVLQHVSKIPITRVTEQVHAEPDNVYVVSPNHHLTMMDGVIKVSPNALEGDRRAPIDMFFRSLARSHGPRAICVVLSGTGANGSMGLKAVKEMGGAAFVQSPREAEFNEMPRNSIATDLVDEVLKVEDIPSKIISYRTNLDKVRIPVEAELRAEDQQHALREIFAHLRTRTGHDFSNYKRPTLLRRIERRINVRNLPDLPSYASFLTQNPDEVSALLKDLLISVTNFFRDVKTFNLISDEVLPAILERKKPGDALRIWVAGCATGEEAYSIAMLCAEKMTNVLDAPKVQIFATDIDEGAIAFARDGLYSINDAADVSPERLRRFFNKEGSGYKIRNEIREMVLFANHNFLKDPPFSHLDLIACRNVFIYLNSQAQERVMETFHFALKMGGFLMLGLSESAESANDLYTTYNREHHVYQARHVSARPYPVPESTPTQSSQHLPAITSINAQEFLTRERITNVDLHQHLLEQYAPPSVVINEEYDIIHLSETAGKYLHITGGEPTPNLLKMVREEIRLELRAALYQAVQRKGAVDAKNLKVPVGNGMETIDIHVRPVFRDGDMAKGFMLVVFEPTSAQDIKEEIVLSSDEPVARQLEDELQRVKKQLRASTEQHEFQAEELKASNEELQAMNEELRASSEELETSKEELQSINEELRTVNQELKIKIEETTLAGNNLQNLINSVDIGTIFLDRNFRVALFTPAARTLFNLIPADIGRHLSDITNKLHNHDVTADAEMVLQNLQTIEREIQAKEDRVFIMRVMPYRTEEHKINGVVITFLDITERKKSENTLRESEERFRAIVSQTAAGIIQADLDGKFTLVNKKFCDMVGYSESELLRKTLFEIMLPEDHKKAFEIFDTLKSRGTPYNLEQRLVPKDESIRWVDVSMSALKDRKDKAQSIAAVFQDITERKALEKQKDEFISMASHELKTPVTSIKAYVEVLQEKFEQQKDAKSAGLMDKLNIQVDRLTFLIRDLLDTTKIAEGKLTFSFEKFDINELIHERIEELQRVSDHHTLVVRTGKLKPISADRERIGQVFTNFISNAIKYSPDGGNVIITTALIGDRVKVSVKDKGIGVAEGDQKNIFTRFFRVSRGKENSFPGMGLGLYISRVIIDRHHGTIGVTSKIGKGSTFYFTLPLKQSKKRKEP